MEDVGQTGNLQVSGERAKACFLLGISQRSGTNYLFQLLRQHPDCVAPGPIWEDFLLDHSGLLKNYAERVFGSWNPKWDVENKVGSQSALLRHLGDALYGFLRLQLVLVAVEKARGEDMGAKDAVFEKLFITKTPSVKNLENFFVLFPECHLLILVRDGRGVVESGVKSFGWNYEEAMREWTKSAETILDFAGKNKSDDRFLVVRYEDIVANEKAELSKIFIFLGLNPGLYDFSVPATLGVIGSSDLREAPVDEVHWKAIKKESTFNPIGRGFNWPRSRYRRFAWIAGGAMSRLGYEMEANGCVGSSFLIKNRLLDLKWRLKKSALMAKSRISSGRQVRFGQR